jgi:hypothetical protein
MVCALGAVATPGLAWAQVPYSTFKPTCLHGPDETAANRARREQALQYAAKVNTAEAGTTVGAPPPQRQRTYRPLEELVTVPAPPAGFDMQFHTDGRTYFFALKDTRDECHYAIFSDQDKWLYEGVPSKGAVTVVPLGTR